MRFFTIVAVIASLASAMPEPVAEPAVAKFEIFVSALWIEQNPP